MTTPKPRIIIDADDAALALKKELCAHLSGLGYPVEDLDYLGKKAADYPEIGYNLARKMQRGEADRGILLCGTGLGMCMVANKVEGVFAGSAHDVYSAERLKKSNDANVLTMGARVIGPELAKMVVEAWLDSEFAGGGSAPKVEQMRQLEKASFSGQEAKTDK